MPNILLLQLEALSKLHDLLCHVISAPCYVKRRLFSECMVPFYADSGRGHAPSLISDMGHVMQLPSVEEIDALLTNRKLTSIVFFLDETFEEIHYDVSTTVLEAVEQLACVIKLESYQTFTLFDCRRVRPPQYAYTGMTFTS